VTSLMALVGSAFATEPWHLLVTWGFLFAIGGSELNDSMRYPVRLTKFQVHCTIQQTRICEWHLSSLTCTCRDRSRFGWFVERRGLANGIILSGTGTLLLATGYILVD